MTQDFNCILSIGSNLEDRSLNLRTAYQLIEEKVGPISRKSSVYESEAWGEENQPCFLNQIILAQTDLDPFQLLDALKSIEVEMGRKKNTRWASRNIDLDILFYEDQVIRTKELIIPHKEIQNRNFILVPLVEVLPEFIHPVSKKSIRSLYLKCKDQLDVYLNEI